MSDERMSVASKVMSNSLILMLTQFSSLVFAFFAQRIILSTLTKDANGFLFSERRFVDLIVIMVVDFGINGVIIRRMVQNPDTASVTLSSSIALRLIMWLAASVACIVYAGLTDYSILDVGLWCCFLMLSSRVGLLRLLLEFPWRRQMKFAFVSMLNITDAILFLAFLFVFRSSLTSTTVILSAFLSALPGFLILFLVDKGRTIHARFVSLKEIRQIIQEGLPLLAAVVLINFHDKIDALMLGWFSSQYEVGIFGAVYVSLAPLTGTIPIALTMAITPVLARYANQNWVQCQIFTLTGLRFLMVAAIVGSTILSTLAPLFIDLVSKGRYSDNNIHFFTFIWVAIPIMFIIYTQEINVVLSQQKRNLSIAIALAVITVTFGLVAIPLWHAMGAIATKIASVNVAFFIAVRTLYSVMKKSVDFLFLFSVITSTLVGIVTAYYMPMVTSLWSAVATSIAAVVVVMLLTRLLRISDFRLWLNIIRARNA